MTLLVQPVAPWGGWAKRGIKVRGLPLMNLRSDELRSRSPCFFRVRVPDQDLPGVHASGQFTKADASKKQLASAGIESPEKQSARGTARASRSSVDFATDSAGCYASWQEVGQ